MTPDRLLVEPLLRSALVEDLFPGDLTTSLLLDPDRQGQGVLRTRQAGRTAGLQLLPWLFDLLDNRVRIRLLTSDGEDVSPGQVLALAEGPVASLLKGERVALNLIQRLSGIATLTATVVRSVEGTGCRVADTRKTTPGLRLLERWAVRLGGGVNHRFNLGDAVLIKDNHLALFPSLSAAVRQVRRKVGHTIYVEVEVESIPALEEALSAGVDGVLLDNFPLDALRAAVTLVQGRVFLEASGGIHLQNARAVAETGVDQISLGALTHSAPALDIGLDLDAHFPGGDPYGGSGLPAADP